MKVVVHPSTSSPEKPDYLPDYYYCYTCQAVVHLALYRLANRKKSSDVDDALFKICTPNNFETYKYLPTEMRESCEALLASYSEPLEELLLERTTNDAATLQLKFCGGSGDVDEKSNTKACYNVHSEWA